MSHADMIVQWNIKKFWLCKSIVGSLGGKFKLYNFLKYNLLLISFRNACYQPMSFRPRMLIVGEPGFGQGSHLAPAVIHALEKFAVYTLDIPVLFGISTTSPEETCAQVIHCCLGKL